MLTITNCWVLKTKKDIYTILSKAQGILRKGELTDKNIQKIIEMSANLHLWALDSLCHPNFLETKHYLIVLALHKNVPVNNQAKMEGLQFSYSSLINYFPLIDSWQKRVLVFGCASIGDSLPDYNVYCSNNKGDHG